MLSFLSIIIEKSPHERKELKSRGWKALGISRIPRFGRRHLKLELRSPPVTPLGVVSDRVPRAHPDPLGDRSVLLLLPRQHFLDLQRFMRSHLRSRWAFSQAPMSLINKF